MSNPLKPIFAGFESKLAVLERRHREGLGLLVKVRAALPEPEKHHVISASYEDGQLTLVGESAAWCARLRYFEDLLRQGLTAAGEAGFTKLRVQVRQARKRR